MLQRSREGQITKENIKGRKHGKKGTNVSICLFNCLCPN